MKMMHIGDLHLGKSLGDFIRTIRRKDAGNRIFSV